MNAVIKLSNTQYLQVLEELLHAKIQAKDEKISLVKLPFVNFIALLVSIFTAYTKQLIEEPLNLFILNFIVKHLRHSNNIIPQLLSFIGKRRAWSACGKNMFNVTNRLGFFYRCCSLNALVNKELNCFWKLGRRYWETSGLKFCKKYN